MRSMQESRDDLKGSAGSPGQGPGPWLLAAPGAPRPAPGKQQVPNNAYSKNEQGRGKARLWSLRCCGRPCAKGVIPYTSLLP